MNQSKKSLQLIAPILVLIYAYAVVGAVYGEGPFRVAMTAISVGVPVLIILFIRRRSPWRRN